jgi:hypothetical protein
MVTGRRPRAGRGGRRRPAWREQMGRSWVEEQEMQLLARLRTVHEATMREESDE